MTIPSNIILPLRADFTDFNDINRYLRDLTFELQRMYESVAQGVNGDIRASVYTQRENWEPILDGTSTTGAFTYTHQVGWVLRRGLWVDVFGDVAWTGVGSATGNLFVTLPYQVANSAQMPFVGVVQPSGITFTGGTSIELNCIPQTYRGEFWNSGSAFTTANQAVVSSGRLIFHVRYLGVSDETNV